MSSSDDEDEVPSSCFDHLALVRFTGFNRSYVGFLNQLISAIVCCLTSLSIGLSIGWSSSAFHKIQMGGAVFTLDGFQQSLVVSALNVGIMFGAIPTSFLMDRIGRKNTLLYSSFLGILHWLCITFAMDPICLYFGRFFGGIWCGISTAITPVYLAENLEPHIRGTIGTLFSIMLYFGILCIDIVGPLATYMELSLFCGLFTVLFICTFPFMPETPYFYVIRGRSEEARESLLWLRGHANVEPELKVIEAFVASEQKHRGRWVDVILDESARRPFLICLAVSFIQKFSGFFTIISYQTVILPSMVGPLSSEGATLVIGVVLVISVISSAFLIDRIGRIPLLNISYVGVIISMIPTGLWFYCNKYDDVANVDNSNWVPFLGFVVFIILFSVGLGPVGNIYPGEVLPLFIKAEAMALVVAFAALITAINTEIFALVNAYIGMYANYWSFAAVSLGGMIFTRYYIIETSGKSLQTIQEEFKEQISRPKRRGDYVALDD